MLPAAYLPTILVVSWALVGCGSSDSRPKVSDPGPTVTGFPPQLRVDAGGSGVTAPDSAAGGSDILPGADAGSALPDTAPGEAGPAYTGEGQSWTVLVYMMADNNLEKASLADLTEMMQVGSTSNLHILAQVDRSAANSAASVGGLANWTGIKRLRVDPSALVELQSPGDVDMGQASALASFIEWGAKAAPADRMALVLWDHGGAWPQFGVDESHVDDGLTVAEMRQGIADGLKAAGLNRPLDLLGFDACLMATYEVAVGLQPVARYLIASEESEPGHGWDFKALALARDTPATKPLELGTAIVNGFLEQARQYADDKNVTMSLSDLSEIATLQSAVATLAAAIGGANASTFAKSVGTVRAKSPTLGESSTGMIDLGRFVADLAVTQPTLASVQSTVNAAMAKVVRSKIAGALQSKTTGLSIYFPSTRQTLRADYSKLLGVADWAGFLASYYGAGQTIPTSAQPQAVSQQGALTTQNGNLVLTGQLKPGTSANISSVSVSFGVILDSDLVVLGNMPGAFDASGAIAGAWDKSILRIQQGTTWDYGFFEVSEEDSGLVSVDIPLAYQESPGSAERDVWYEIVLDSAIGKVVSKTYYEQVGDAFGELTPAAGSTFKSKLPFISTDSGDATWTPGSESFDGTVSLDISLETLPKGTQVFMVLSAEDYGGASATVYGLGTL